MSASMEEQLSEKAEQPTRIDPLVLLVAVGCAVCLVVMPGPLTVLLVLALGATVFLTRGRTPLERIGVGAVIFGAFAILMFGRISLHLSGVREKANRSSCKGHLKQLGLALIMYRDNQGGETQYPPHDGSDFLMVLYLTGVTSAPNLYICSSTDEGNGQGADIALGATQACGYAGRRNSDQRGIRACSRREAAARRRWPAATARARSSSTTGMPASWHLSMATSRRSASTTRG